MPMILRLAVATLAFAAPFQSADPKQIKGTLNDRIVAEAMMAQIELRPAAPGDVPGMTEGDRAFVVRTPQFRPPGSPSGLLVGYLERGAVQFIFVDRDLDGRLTDSEKLPQDGVQQHVDLMIPGLASPLPFRLKVVPRPAPERPFMLFTAAFRVEGHVDINGRKTLVSLPYNLPRNIVDIRQGKIGVDTNDDGTIDSTPGSGREMQFARGDRVMFRVGEKYVSFEAADFATHTLSLREHAPEEYTVVELTVGSRLPDFSFTDFDGKERKLSDFRGKHLLIDVWGSWCKPCVEDLPKLKTAYERFKDRGFEILGIDYEHGAALEHVRELLRQKSVTWTNATPSTVKELVQERWRIMAFPTLMLLDPDGILIETSGALRGNRLGETLERVLTQPSAQARFTRVINLETTSEDSANVSMGDLDGDGDLDLVLAKGRHGPLMDRVLINDGKGAFTASDLGPKADRTYTTALADLDGDGDLDVLASNDAPDEKVVYLNDGKGKFIVAGTWGMPKWATRNASVADLNSDGKPDAIAANRPGPSYVCLNKGGARFGSECSEIPSKSATSIVAADFNKDGSIDLAVPGRDGEQSYIYLNDGKASFSSRVPFGPADATARVAAAADFNRDGKMDLVMTDERGASMTVYLNDGKGTLTAGFHVADKKRVPYAITSGDLNGDGRADIVIGYIEAPNTVFFNDGSGAKFTPLDFGDGQGTAYGFAIGDVNGDKLPDIAVARSGAPNVLYLNGK